MGILLSQNEWIFFLFHKLHNEFKLNCKEVIEMKVKESLLQILDKSTVLVQSHTPMLSSGGKLQQYELKNSQFCTAHHAEFLGL